MIINNSLLDQACGQWSTRMSDMQQTILWLEVPRACFLNNVVTFAHTKMWMFAYFIYCCSKSPNYFTCCWFGNFFSFPDYAEETWPHVLTRAGVSASLFPNPTYVLHPCSPYGAYNICLLVFHTSLLVLWLCMEALFHSQLMLAW